MKGEILTLETAQKLAYVNTALAYIDERLRNAYTKYDLSGDSVVCLQCIEMILKGKRWK